MTRLQGKVAIVTGAASGIGEAIARRFVADGAKLVAADVQDARGQALVASLGGEAVFRHCDVSQEADVSGLVAHALERFGRVDVMVNNAGIPGPGGPVEGIAVDAFDAAIGVLLRGVFLGMKHAAPVMKRQRSGSIVSTASVAGLRTGFGSHPYSAAKAAVIHLTHSVAMELGESGVRVNCICPGAIATPIFGKAFGLAPEAIDRSVDVVKQAFAGAQPLQRTGLPEDIANAAAWLASDDADFVNGHALVVDGGLSGGRLWSEALQRREVMRTAMSHLG